jgi:hypothetical protein
MNLSEEVEAIDVVARAVDRITRRGRLVDFELSNGIVLTIKSIPPLLLQAVNNEFQLPDAPKIYMEEKGREEENPHDPNYLKECQRITEQQDLAISDLILAIGTNVRSVPDGYFPPESDDWIETVEFANRISGKPLTIDRDDVTKRYLFWLRFYALETGGDVALAQGLPMQLAGIREGEVEDVIDSFRGIPEWRADPEGSATSGSQNGDTANRAARRSRSRNRGT